MSAPGPTDFIPLSTLGGGGGGVRRPADDGAPVAWLEPVKYDRWKRYLLPVPGGDPSETEPWTRVTTLAKLVGGEHGLTIWSERELLRGVGMRASLRALLADGHDDKAVLDEVREAAKEAAGMHDARRWGTAVHAGVESAMLHGGLLAPGIDLSEQYGRDVWAAVRCLHENGVRVRMIERLVVHATLKYAGRLDYLVEVELPATALAPARTVLRVLDVKTGARITEQGQQVGAQLAGYVNATHLYDPASRAFEPLPSDLDTSTGYVLAVREGRAALHEIDLLDGWIDMRLAVQQHRRGKAGTSMSPVGSPVVVEPPILDDLRAAVTERAEAAPLALVPAPVEPEHVIEQGPPALVTPEARLEAAIAGAFAESSEKTATGRAKPRCSKCRQPGHRARTCTADVASESGPSTVAPSETLCAHAAGWSRRESDGAWVCGDCGRPSEATVEAMRTGAPLPSGLEPIAPPVDPYSDRIKAAQSQADLQALWSEGLAHGGWTDAHTALAAERAPGLPPVFLPF